MKIPPNKKGLPWWVEILFVQIGLPDSWLRKYLKQKKEIKLLISEQKKNAPSILIIVIAIAYLSPLVKQASSHNKCIKSTYSLVSKSIRKEKALTNDEAYALATNFCNGGAIKYNEHSLKGD